MILLTGSSGFVGTHLVKALNSQKIPFIKHLRSEFRPFIHPYSVVLHLAGRAHVMNDKASDPLAEFRASNCDYAVNLANQAIAAGAKRFIYISSVKVNGEETTLTPFTELSSVAPRDPYGVSKYEAELALTELSARSGLEIVIVRPPLIYGSGVKANFARLVKIASKGFPLPLGSIHNSRSLLYVKNLVDFLILCAYHPKAANETFLLSDGDGVSTTKLLHTLAIAQGAPSRLLPVPVPLLSASLRLIGKADIAQRLLGSLEVDSCKARELLGWTPPFSFKAAVYDMFKNETSI